MHYRTIIAINGNTVINCSITGETVKIDELTKMIYRHNFNRECARKKHTFITVENVCSDLLPVGGIDRTTTILQINTFDLEYLRHELQHAGGKAFLGDLPRNRQFNVVFLSDK